MSERSLLTAIVDVFNHGDPRAEHYFLMKSPLPVAGLLLSYLTFVFKVGPAIMKNRKPMKLNNLMAVYNWAQIICNAVLFFQMIQVLPKVNLFCTPADPSNNPFATTMVNLHYKYAMLKILDLLDTIFFVVRKKNNQLTFLHVYHHVMMVCFSWMMFKFLPAGHLIFLGFANVFVHAVMYFYYFLSSWDSSYKQSIWWKKHITQLQIAQHCFVFVSFLLPLLNGDCSYPKFVLCLYLSQAVMMIYLFTKFYIKAYVKNGRNDAKIE